MIFDKIQNDIKEAMKAKDNLKRDCLRSIVSEIKNKTVNEGKPITEDVCINVIQKSAKTHNDSISQFKEAGRIDLLEKEQKELGIISEYLPKMLSEDEMKALVEKLIFDNQIEAVKKNMGKVMKLLSQHPDKASIDMKKASQYIGQLLK